MSIGISHDVNNILQVLLAQISLLEKDVTERNAVKRLARMKEAIGKAGKAIQELLRFAREGNYRIEVFEINGAIKEAQETINWILEGKKVLLKSELAEDLFVKCDKNLLQQALFNILKNAAEAINMSGKGDCITIKTSGCAGNALIEVSDDGPGIPPLDLERLFMPFFTTKGEGKGSGLGLSFSRCVIEGMGGRLGFRSSGETGTVFTIVFPESPRVRERRTDEGSMKADCKLPQIFQARETKKP